MTTFKVGAIQMTSSLKNKEANLANTKKLIREGVDKGAKVLVVPELFNTGYRVEDMDYELAETIPGETTSWMKNLAKEYNIYLIGCILEKSSVRSLVYDTAITVGPDGLIEKYRKNKLWDQEKNRFLKGEQLKTVDLGFVKIGVQICYEVGFPEPARFLCYDGADVLVYSSAFGQPRSYAWDLAPRARALENGAYVIASNLSGVEKGETVFAGMSRIVDPQGKVLIEATEENEVVTHEVDLGFVEKQRQTIPYLRDFDSHYYKEEDL